MKANKQMDFLFKTGITCYGANLSPNKSYFVVREDKNSCQIHSATNFKHRLCPKISFLDAATHHFKSSFSKPQKNSLLSNLPIYHLRHIFFQKLSKLSVFLMSDNDAHWGILSDRTQLHVGVFTS